MRVAQLSPYLGLLCAGIGAVFSACGSDAENESTAATGSSSSGSGGSSSSSGATTTGTTGSTSSSSSGPASSSSGVGGGACEQACDKIANECGFGPVCDMGGQFNCDAPNADCYGECILAASCEDLVALVGGGNPPPELVACVTDCQGGGQGGAGGGGPQGCQDCVQGSCTSEGLACLQDDTCGSWVQCINDCMGDAACIQACGGTFSSPAIDAIKACMCTDCSTECAPIDPCNAAGTGGTGGV